MKICIVGAGLTGLTAALRLLNNGHDVTIYEKGSLPGGLAGGHKEKEWNWTLENFYHHVFTNDHDFIGLLNELGLKQKLIYKTPKSSIYVNNSIYQFDSPLSLLNFAPLRIDQRIRAGIATLFLKTTGDWKKLEKLTAHQWLMKYYGKKAYELLWEPLLKSKFHDDAKNIPMAWFWARIKKRTTQLGYFEGGFQVLSITLEKKIKELGGVFFYNTEIKSLKEIQSKFDRIIFTGPTQAFLKLSPELPIDYKNQLSDLKMIGSLCLIIRLREQFLTDNTYWLNINDSEYPFVAVVEHTNFIDKKYYNKENILYVGGYYPQNHRYFKMTKEEIMEEFLPYLKRINQKLDQSIIINYQLSISKNAQPIVPLNYSKIILPFKTPISNVYLANIQQVYPWDRGINYAIKMGNDIANEITNNN